MEVTPDSPRREPPSGDPPQTTVLGEAAAALRRHTENRWVEVSDRVVAKAMRATRRSYPIRAQASSGPIQISEQVLVSYLRAAIDGTVPGSALTHVTLEVKGRDELSGVIIQLIAEFGLPLLPVADEVRERAIECLQGLLGPTPTPVSVLPLHVHFTDVVTGPPDAGRPDAAAVRSAGDR